MTTLIKTTCLLLVLTGCVRTNQLKSVLDDLSNTPPCDINNVLTSDKDTKDTLAAKIIILNYKLDCHVDMNTYQQQKIKSYRKLY